MGLGYYDVRSFVIEAKVVQLNYWHCTKYKFYIKQLFSDCDYIRSFLRIW